MASSERTSGDQAPATSSSAVPSASPPPPEATEGSRGRRVAFRVVAILTALWVLALSVFGLIEIVLMWLPGDTLSSVGEALDLGDLDLAHRTHYMSIGVIHWTLVLGVLVQLRRPERREAPMLHVLAFAIGLSVTASLRGDLRAWLLDVLIIVLPLLLLGSLHPRASELMRTPRWDRGMVVLAAVGAVPWLTLAVTQAQRQWRAVAGDTHAEMDHWSVVALMALLIVACSFIGASNRSGWRLTAGIAALAAINHGLHSLAYPEPASAASTPWAIAALVWGVAYATSMLLRSRSHRSSASEGT